MGTEPRRLDEPLARGPDWALSEPWPRFLIDQNNPWLFAPAFRIVGYRAAAAVEVDLAVADDLDVIRFCGERRLVWVTEDIDSRRRGEYVALVRDLKVSAIFLRPPRAKGWPMRIKFEVLARNLRTLESALTTREPRYFVCTERRSAREVATFSTALGTPRRATPARRR